MHRLSYIVIDRPSMTYGYNHCFEVVVLKHYIRNLAGDISAGVSQCNAYVGCLKGGSVIYTVPCHGNHLPCLLERLNYL